MLQQPLLINRPIVVTPLGTRLCRPSEAVLDILPDPQRGACKEDGEPVIDAQGPQDNQRLIAAARRLAKSVQFGAAAVGQRFEQRGGRHEEQGAGHRVAKIEQPIVVAGRAADKHVFQHLLDRLRGSAHSR